MTRRTLEKVAQITQAWETHFPEATFSGLTLAQFKEGTKPSLDVRAELADNAARSAGLMAKRAVVDAASNALAERIVAGVKTDPAHGPDGVLWAAMGFVRKSERGTGLTRRTKLNRTQPQVKVTNGAA